MSDNHKVMITLRSRIYFDCEACSFAISCKTGSCFMRINAQGLNLIIKGLVGVSL